MGASLAVFKVSSWVVGWPPARLSAPGIQVAPGATGTCSGEAGEDQGIVGPPSIPFSSGAAPKKNRHRGKGGGGGRG